MTIQQKRWILNRLTGRMERMTLVEEAAYHVRLCLWDLADPKASAKRKQRAARALAYWRTR